MSAACPQSTKPHQDQVMTPPSLASAIVKHFAPTGYVMEPCRGEGAFYHALENSGCLEVDWCEVSQGRDYLKTPWEGDWIITNPPWSKKLFNAFLAKSLKESDNIVFLVAMNKLMTRLRMEMIDEARFGFKEILRVSMPKSWPSSGFEYAAMYFQRGWTGDCKFSKL